MSYLQNKCWECDGEKSGQWGFGGTQDIGCLERLYSSQENCEQQNNARMAYVDPSTCLVFFNDNGSTFKNVSGQDMLMGQYPNAAAAALQSANPLMTGLTIPTSSDPTNLIYNRGTSNSSSWLNENQSRLWAYDLTGNTLFYVDAFKHEGSDIGMSESNMWVGCQYNLHRNVKGVFTVNEYGYTMSNNEVSTFVKTPQKVYRFVNSTGALLTVKDASGPGTPKTGNNMSAGTKSTVDNGLGLGQAMSAIDDRTIVFDDRNTSGLYVANLDELWSGDTCVLGTQGQTTSTNTSGAIDSDGNKYKDFSSHSYDNIARNLNDAYYHCSQGTDYKIYTVVARPLLNLRTTGGAYTQGDAAFVPTDPVFGGDPSVVVTYYTQGGSGANVGCLQNPGGAVQVPGGLCSARVARWKMPTVAELATNNWPIQQLSDRVTSDSATTGVEAFTTPGSVALISDVASGEYYSTTGRFRWNFDKTTLSASNPTQMTITTYDINGIQTNSLWNFGGGFRGAAQVPSCVTSSAYTWDCGLLGCTSTLGSTGLYTALTACTEACISWSCQTACLCPSGYTLNSVTDNCEALATPIINTGLAVTKITPSSNQGANGTRLCLDLGCNSYVDKIGPNLGVSTSLENGFWGQTGSYLDNGRLNYTGVWPGTSSPGPAPLNTTNENDVKWYGITRCITVNNTSTYLIGVGADDHFRVSIDSVIQLDTTTGVNGFDPADITTGVNTILTPGTDVSKYWWVVPFVLSAGTHTINIEGASVGGNAGLGAEIVGPFTASTAFTTTNSLTALTYNEYTTNTIFSTADLFGIQSSSSCDLSLPTFPFGLNSFDLNALPGAQMDLSYPNPWGTTNSAPIGGTGGVGADCITPYTSGFGNLDNGNTLTPSQRWLVAFADNTLLYNGSNVNTMYFTDFLFDFTLWDTCQNGQNCDALGNLLPLPNGSDYCYTSNAGCLPTQQGAYKVTFEGFMLSGFKKTGANSTAQMTNTADDGTGTYTSQQNTSGISPTFTKWTDFIDWLNANGLVQSSVPDPGTSNYPMVDYNASYWQVVYASLDYWTATDPQPNPGQNQLERDPNTGGIVFGVDANYPCQCTPNVSGYFDSQVNECPAGYIYDGCQNTCVSVTGCTVGQVTPGFTGGCASLIGTGATDTYLTYSGCNMECGSGSTINFYDCGTSACVYVGNGITGTTGAYTSLTECEETCSTWNCESAGCTSQTGSGGTYTTQSDCLSSGACQSYNCTAFGGCIVQNGTGGTYTNQSICLTACTSYECLNNGCQSYPGSGHTFSAESACTATCTSYECTTDCCQVYNLPYYGTGGTYTAESACTASCVSWNCQNNEFVASDATIYAFYDTTSFGTAMIKEAVLALSAWTMTIPGFTGQVHHGFYTDEKWLKWAASPWTGLSGGTQGAPLVANGGCKGGLMHQWNADNGWNASFWDNTIIGTQYNNCPGQASPMVTAAGAVVTAKGTAPTATTNDSVLTIIFIDESENNTDNTTAYHQKQIPGGSDIPQFAFQSGNPQYNPDQPSMQWKKDYTAFTNTYATLTASTGQYPAARQKWFVYPNRSTPSGYIGDYNRELVLNVVASIDLGNKVPVDGTWVTDTAPRRAGTFPFPPTVHNGLPVQRTNATDLTALETSNPYYSEGYGNLSSYGFDYNVTFAAFSPTDFIGDLTTVLSGTSSGGTVCTSACTSPTQQYPFTAFSECVTACTKYNCTDTGCVPVSATSATTGLYNSLEDCTGGTFTQGGIAILQPCTSYNCGSSGCTIYNSPDFGSGGTFTTNINCMSGCASYECMAVTQLVSPTTQGCQQTVGSGGTFYNINLSLAYSACTGSCKSWECENPCSGASSGTSSCTEYPNTGFTFSSVTACTGSCVADWYCVPATTVESANCSGRTMIDLGSLAGVPTSSIVLPTGQPNGALELIAHPNNGLQFTNFSTMKFEFGSSNNQTNHPCIGPNGYESGYIHSVQGNASILQQGGPNSNIFYSWDSLIYAYSAMGLAVDFQTTYEDLLSWPPNATNNNGVNLIGPISWNTCECVQTECSIQCVGVGGYVPLNYIGPYTTSGDAYNSCCAVTYSCVPEQELDTCDSKILIPGIYANVVDAFTWVSTHLPNTDIGTLKWETNAAPNSQLSGCTGVNGGLVASFDVLSYSLLNSGTDYTVWNTFIAELIGDGLTAVTSGMSFEYVQEVLETASGSSINMCANKCYCETIGCYCIEVDGSGGTYTTYSECITGCCPSTLLDSTWNCVSSGPFQPICNTRPFIGLFTTPWAELDWFRTGAPTTSFDANKFVHPFDTNGNPNSAIQTQTFINNVFGNLQYGWQDCYQAIYDGQGNMEYYPYTYVTTISHPMLSGTSYSTYQTFYNDAVAAGVTGIASSTVSGLCEEIGVQLAPNIYNPNNNGCNITTKKCCNDSNCYCYELWFSAGTYLNSSSCLSACCDNQGWMCSLDAGGLNNVCIPGAIQNATPALKWFVTQADCQASLSSGFMPVGGYYLNTWNGQNVSGLAHECLASTGVTTWNCLTASTIDTCDDSLGEIWTVCPGTLGNQTGVPYNSCPGGCFQYPFSSSSGVIGSQGVGQVEEIFTTANFWDPNVAFTAATWQYDDGIYTPVKFQCNGYKFNDPLFKLVSIGNTEVNGGTPYPSWSAFVTAAVAAGYAITTQQNVATANICSTCWISVVEPCECRQLSGCTCVEVVGTGGQYQTEPMCLQYCCDPIDSWDCTMNGCLDPQDGSGAYSGPQGFNDCVNDCWEWECEPGGLISDSCSAKIDTGVFGTGYDQISFMADPLNGLQSSNFTNYKCEAVGSPFLQSYPYCDGPNTPYNGMSTKYMCWYMITSKRCYGCPPATPAGIGANYNSYNWADVIAHWQSFGAQVNLQMTGPQAKQYMFDNHNVSYDVNGSTCACESTPCDCTHIVGTGHTGTHPNTNYNQCVSACCGTVVLSDCSIFINDKNSGVHLYDMAGNNTTLLFTDPGFTDYDIANHNTKLWIYNQSVIREYDITFPNFSATFNRDIQIGVQPGRGLVAKTSLDLLSAGDQNVNHVDISSNIAVVTPLFNLPLPTIGDIYYDSVSNQILVIYGDYPVNNGQGAMFIGKFTYTGTLLEQFDITANLQLLNNERFEGIFCDNGTLYTVSNKNRVFEIFTSPTLSLAFSPTQIIPTAPGVQPDLRGATSTTGQKQPCLCPLLDDTPAWNCIAGTVSNICVQQVGGVYSTLASCQANCGPQSGVTWNCEPGGASNTCSGATQYLPYPLVGDTTSAWEYISLNSSLWSLNTSLITYSEGSPVYQACFSPDALPLHRVTHVSCPSLNGGQQYTSWFDFVMAGHLEGIGQIPLPTANSCVDYGHVLAAMNGYFNLNYSIQMGQPTACQCYTAPCSCNAVMGLGGQYLTQMDCITNCCGPDTTGWDCWAPGQTCLPCYINCDYPNNDSAYPVPPQYVDALAWCNDECGIVDSGYNCEFGTCYYVQNQPAMYATYNDCVTHCQVTDNYYDCVNGGCVGLTNNVVGPYLTYADCLHDCPNTHDDCFKCCKNNITGYITQLSPNADPCACPKGTYEVPCHGDPGNGCVQNVSCANDYIWSWAHCQCVCEQNVSCANGFVWSALACGCIPKRQGPVDIMFMGTPAEVSVKIADYKNIALPTVTRSMSVAMNDLEEQVKGGIIKDSEGKIKQRCTSCGGTSQAYGSCLVAGCLTMIDYKFDDTDIVQWSTTESTGIKTYDCIGGICVSSEEGMFTTLSDCLSQCDSLGDKGSTKTLIGKKTKVNSEDGNKGREAIPKEGPSGIYYSCGIQTNALVGEQQKACIPSTVATAGAYSTLEECLNSGCAGFMTTTSPIVSVNGLKLTNSTITPIPMCCEEWINASTTSINVENCKTNCCDGTQTWFPLYNNIGDNTYYDSAKAYLTRELVPLVNDGTITITNSKNEYLSKGYHFQPAYSGTKIPVCLTNIVGYTNEKACYSTVVAALTQASVQNCIGYSTTEIGGTTCYTACNE